MADVASSSLDSQSKNNKPVVVRVKRKASQSPLEALWLEINERPLKRPLLDFEKLAISDSSSKAAAEEPKATKVLVHHVETVINSDLTVDFLQSFMPYCSGASQPKVEKLGERQNIKEDNKQDKLLAKARHDQEVLSKTARFEQIWKRRNGNRGETKTEDVNEICHLYDIVRIDVEENVNGNGNGKEVEGEEDSDLEERKIMASYLPLLREFVPDGAVQVESDIRDYMSKKASKNDYVYDFYAVKEDDINIIQDEESFPFPLVQVDEDDEFYDGPDDPDYESYDSNAEDNPAYDYPEEDEDDEEDDDVRNESSEDKSEVSDDDDDEGGYGNGLSDTEDMEPRNAVAPHLKDADLIYYDEFSDNEDDD